jgi:hypothetical protein
MLLNIHFPSNVAQHTNNLPLECESIHSSGYAPLKRKLFHPHTLALLSGQHQRDMPPGHYIARKTLKQRADHI